ncbi:DUF5689 domain-containing protein [Gaetbulibacter aestuarii]|uniref:DUF5689 domain-containing protein n=1 Tax=Gaetbulibacter aestuarii TaxID=1502358 RepID=A0ABW7MYP0_9FLAO
MKAIKSIFWIILICFLSSCVQDGPFDIPTDHAEDLDIPASQITTFKVVKSIYDQAANAGNDTAVIESDTDLFIEGYVISSDRAGNFYKELIIQNKTDDSNLDNDPRLGIKIAINASSLSDTYQFGQKVYVKVNGLTVGETEGVFTLGKGTGATVEPIQASEYKKIVLRTQDIVSITPKIETWENLEEADENTLVMLKDVQLNRFELGASFAAESYDEFDGLRHLESCASGVSSVLQTSTFSDFKAQLLPQGTFDIQGIFSRDYGDDFNVLLINSRSDITNEKADRCDPEVVSCGLSNSVGEGILFYDDFELERNNQLIEGSGWTNYIEAGSEGWEAFSSSSSNASIGRSARFNSASSGDLSNIGWLITPSIDLDNYSGVTLQFKTSNSRADSSFMEVLCSSDWDGRKENIRSATWKVLEDAYVVKDTDPFAPWFNSGPVALSCLSGTIHIAFKYTGGGQDSFDGVYELDEVKISYQN